jgi:hypothetical protein
VHLVSKFTLAVLICGAARVHAAVEDMEFVAEHMGEIPMDNRYATLPIWGESRFSVQAAYARTHSQTLAIDGPMFSLAAAWPLAHEWALSSFVFFDNLKLSSGVEHRPLDVHFVDNVPLTLPVAAEFTGLSGSAQDAGIGFAIRRSGTMRFMHAYQWNAGVLWQRVTLHDFALDFRVLEGPDAGATGRVDYSATYSHFTPFVGIAWPREHGNWGLMPRVLAALPRPRRGVVGHIQGPGYDLSGDTGAHGSKPFGDPALTIGFDVTYHPWNLSIDFGSAITQAVIEPLTHEGVAQNWLLSARWSY